MSASSPLALRIISLLLKPVVRFALRNALGVREVTEALKKSFVEGAAQEFRESGARTNISRISVVTGIHRRDVIRILESQDADAPPVNLISRIISQWENDRRFQTKSGSPRVLSIDGPASEFNELVRSVSSDLHPGTILFQLERLKLVERTSHGLKFVTAIYEVREDLERGYAVLSQDLHDLSCAVEENLTAADSVPQLHARTDYDNVFIDALPEIREWLLREGALLHQRARTYLSQFDRDLNPHIRKEAGARVVLGTFGRVESLAGEQEKEKAL